MRTPATILESQLKVAGCDGKRRAPQGRITRLHCCMGTAQLVSVLAATRTRAAESPSHEYDDYLIVHDLYAPDGQDGEFAHCIERLARAVSTWKGILYLSTAELAALADDEARLRQTLDIEHVDEMHLPQNEVPLAGWLAAAYPDAERFCYGDAFGLNFSTQYFLPRPRFPRVEKWRKGISRWFAEYGFGKRREIGPHSAALSFDLYYLLYPNSFDQTVPNCRLIGLETYRDLYREIGQALDGDEPWIRHVEAVANSGSETAILMTSNFSESRRMEVEGELAAYGELLRNVRADALIIKPHPRDSKTKIKALVQRLEKQFQQMIVLDDPSSFYLPFEAVYDRCFRGIHRNQQPTVFCVSSACIAFESLFSVRCQLGFGEKTVRRHFKPKWITARIEHENDLQRLTSTIRQTGSGTCQN